MSSEGDGVIKLVSIANFDILAEFQVVARFYNNLENPFKTFSTFVVSGQYKQSFSGRLP